MRRGREGRGGVEEALTRCYTDASGGVLAKIQGKEAFLYIHILEAIGKPSLCLSGPAYSWMSISHTTEAIRHALALFYTAAEKKVSLLSLPGPGREVSES